MCHWIVCILHGDHCLSALSGISTMQIFLNCKISVDFSIANGIKPRPLKWASESLGLTLAVSVRTVLASSTGKHNQYWVKWEGNMLSPKRDFQDRVIPGLESDVITNQRYLQSRIIPNSCQIGFVFMATSCPERDEWAICSGSSLSTRILP